MALRHERGRRLGELVGGVDAALAALKHEAALEHAQQLLRAACVVLERRERRRHVAHELERVARVSVDGVGAPLQLLEAALEHRLGREQPRLDERAFDRQDRALHAVVQLHDQVEAADLRAVRVGPRKRGRRRRRYLDAEQQKVARLSQQRDERGVKVDGEQRQLGRRVSGEAQQRQPELGVARRADLRAPALDDGRLECVHRRREACVRGSGGAALAALLQQRALVARGELAKRLREARLEAAHPRDRAGVRRRVAAERRAVLADVEELRHLGDVGGKRLDEVGLKGCVF